MITKWLKTFTDEKLATVRQRYGWEGYGIVVALLDLLGESEDGTRQLDYALLAFQLGLDDAGEDKLRDIVETCDFFTIDKASFYYAPQKREIDKKMEAARKREERKLQKMQVTDDTQPSVKHVVTESKVVPVKTKGRPRKTKAQIEEEEGEPTNIKLIMSSGEYYTVRSVFLEEMKKIYTGVDIEQELTVANGWLLSNPVRRKTVRGMKAFINNWLHNAQNKYNRNKAGNNAQQQVLKSPYANAHIDFDKVEY